MALINQSYTPPGVYTTEVFNSTAATLVTSNRVPVLIGEGQEFFTESNIELHRGSSATADDQIVGENISDQVTGSTRTYQLTYFPVVTGDGTGTVTTDPTKIKVLTGDENGMPVAVVSLNGKTGQFMTQSIIPEGTNVLVNYYFKKTDTLITGENLTPQIPTFAALTVESVLNLSLSIPGYLGNNVSLTFTKAATGSNLGVSDANAVTGAGTDSISIELLSPGDVVRTFADVAALINAGVSTLSGGFVTVASIGSGSATAATVLAPTNFAAGAGQSTNTVFKVANVPIVDGSNGGVVTTDPTDVTVEVSGVKVTVTAVDGSTGLVMLAQGVLPSATLTITYYTNNYQDTSDLLPSANVASIVEVGYGENSSNFIEGVDYVLNGNSISWGASATTAPAISTPGFAPLDATVITSTLVDEKVYLRSLSGVVSGRNTVFTLPDVPVDGSGLDRSTDDPTKISIYVGADPVTALTAGPVRVARLSGAAGQVTLYNPPAQGQNVYGSTYRSTLDDHEFTLAVATAAAPGQGTFTVTDELGQIAPVVSVGAATVADANFTDLGVVWPSNFPDLAAALGAADETVTLTFQNDGLSNTITQATQASFTFTDSGAVPRITFLATTPGVAGNTVTIAMVGGPTGAADAAAITVTGTAISVATVKADNVTTRSWQDIVNLFTTYPPSVAGAGTILCSGVQSIDLTAQAQSLSATNLTGGAAAVTQAFANRFLVSTSRTSAQAKADGRGLTGGATTPGGANTGVGAVGSSGYLGQTYVDAVTALKFTIVDPANALSYGYVQLPSPRYSFAPGDTLTFTVSSEAGHLTGSTPTIAIPGIRTQVVTTLGMNPGDTAVVSTFNKAGTTPAVGDYYYVTYTTEKVASDMALQVFNSVTDAYNAYGQPNNINNRLAIAVSLMNLNGGGQFACIQVPTQTGLALAADQSFIDAINSLTVALPGTGRKAGVIIPLSTSATVQQALGLFLTKQATSRNKGEAQGYIGFDQFATAAQISATATSIANQRVIAVTPNALGYNIQGPTDTVAVEYLLTGEFAAAALAGLVLAPQNDVATTVTGQNVVGFTRSLNVFDEPTLNLLATAGVTCLIDDSGALEVRHYKTTNPANPLTSEPYVTTTADYINQAFRSMLKQFKGRKMTADLPNSITIVLNGALTAWNGNIISASQQLTVVPDATDPTTINISVPVRPMFSLLYINVELTVNLS
jgi:hypothetical protein